ncbi:MAG: hypothetical protein AAB303_04355 [Chloroflexota bacterium]
MPRGATLTYPFSETLLLIQRALTVVLSGHNAFYFATYRSHHGKRRLGAIVLTFINLAIGAESLAFGLLPWTARSGNTALTLGSRLVAASLSLAVALTIAALIFRQRIRRM